MKWRKAMEYRTEELYGDFYENDEKTLSNSNWKRPNQVYLLFQKNFWNI